MRELKIGRLPSNDIIINDNSVSREHAVLIVSGNEYSIRDLNSSNGTYVNGMRIHGVSAIKRNDIIKVGSSLVPWMNYLSMNGMDYQTKVNESKPTNSPQTYEFQMALPNSGTALAFGIVGLIFSIGFIGVIFNIIAILLASSAIDKYHFEPKRYTSSSLSNAKTGKVLAIVGLCIFALAVIVLISSFN
jgi:hypothetical protein